MAAKFKVKDLVWAKIKGYSPWPAMIVEPNAAIPQKTKLPQHWVFFFGTYNFAWVLDINIVHHSDEMLHNAKLSKLRSFSWIIAIKEMEEKGVNIPDISFLPVNVKMEQGSSEVESAMEKSKIPRNRLKKQKETKKKILIKSISTKQRKMEKERPRGSFIKFSQVGSALEELKMPRRRIKTKKIQKKIPKKHLSKKQIKKKDPKKPISKRQIKIKIPTVLVNRQQVCNHSSPFYMHVPLEVKKNITPTNKRIGFLGFESIGSLMVKNLLSSGHNVVVWSPSAETCDPFVEEGAVMADSPANVVRMCDIIFSCFNEEDEANRVIFQANGVASAMSDSCCGGNKSYVEMTTLTPHMSDVINYFFMSNGLRYLEASIMGSMQEAEKGILSILAAGDYQAFSDSITCFAAWAKITYYISCNLGDASKLRLTLRMLSGTIQAALGEAMALLRHCKLNSVKFLDILREGPLNCPLVLDKGLAMMTENWKPIDPLKKQQKDLALALSLGEICDQPLSLAASANEAFVRAKSFHLSEKDASAVYRSMIAPW